MPSQSLLTFMPVVGKAKHSLPDILREAEADAEAEAAEALILDEPDPFLKLTLSA